MRDEEKNLASEKLKVVLVETGNDYYFCATHENTTYLKKMKE